MPRARIVIRIADGCFFDRSVGREKKSRRWKWDKRTDDRSKKNGLISCIVRDKKGKKKERKKEKVFFRCTHNKRRPLVMAFIFLPGKQFEEVMTLFFFFFRF